MIFFFLCAVESPWSSSTVFWWIVLKCKKCFSASASIHLLTWAIYIPSITESAKKNLCCSFQKWQNSEVFKVRRSEKKTLDEEKRKNFKKRYKHFRVLEWLCRLHHSETTSMTVGPWARWIEIRRSKVLRWDDVAIETNKCFRLALTHTHGAVVNEPDYTEWLSPLLNTDTGFLKRFK